MGIEPTREATNPLQTVLKTARHTSTYLPPSVKRRLDCAALFMQIFREDGTVEMKESVEIGLTIDERIADGYYYSRTVQLLKKLLENPELLERPLNEEVEY